MSKCCTCGYERVQGRDGSHRCSDTMQKTIDALRAELALAKSVPMQPIIDGRFKENKIVTYCLENVTDMNKLAVKNFTQEDREQFYQLIGYSLGGYADLSQVSDESYFRAEKENSADEHG